MSESTELVAGTLRGYRIWEVRGHQELCSITGSTIWPDGEVAAFCRTTFNNTSYTMHSAPRDNCTCGLYGVYQPHADQLDEITRWPTIRHGIAAVGAIEAYGKVIMGEYGFRAEKAKILAVAPIQPYIYAEHVFGKPIQDRYPSVKVFGDYKDLVTEFPPTQEDMPTKVDYFKEYYKQQMRLTGI